MKKKTLAILLSIAMVLSLFPTSAFASGITSGFSDMPNNWSTKALENAVKNGLLKGDNGKILPNANLTRAQMATIVNRAFGTTEKASLSSYTDVAANSWYYDDMAKAVQMKTFVGSGDKLNPDSNITREEAFVVLTRAIKLSGANQSTLDKFPDKALVSRWAKDAAASLISAGYISGSNGQLNPKQDITRAEFAQIMDNILKNYIKTTGTYTTDYTGNMMINVPGVTLKNIKITGDLIIGDGVGNGDVTLDSVVVTGRTVIRGGGVNSIKIIGKSNIKNMVIARVEGQVRVYAEDGTQMGDIIVDGSDDVIIEGNFGEVIVTAPDITVTATNADIVAATIDGDRSIIIVSDKSTIKTATIVGDNAKVITLTGAKIGDIIANGEGSTISGTGSVGKVEANGNNTAVTTPGTWVTAAAGSTGNTAGDKPVAGGATESVPVIVVGGGGSSGGSGNGSSSIANLASVVTVKGLVAGATYTMTQADATNEAAVKKAIEDKVATLALDGVTTTVTKVHYTPAVAGTVGTPAGTNGTYTFTVGLSKGAATDTTATLTMTVTATAFDAAQEDTEKPVITLTGNATENVANGAAYTDAGVTITDNKDTGLVAVVTYTKDAATVALIDTSVAGTYTIHYNVSDAAGNAAVEVTRTVIVAAETYTVTFDSYGGSAVAPITNVAKNATVTLPAAPTRAGCEFGGWITSFDGKETEFTGATAVTANVTVYAIWDT